MNNNYYRLIICFVIAFAGLSCSEQPIEDIAMKQHNFYAQYYLTPDTLLGSLVINIEVELPESFYDEEVLKNVQEQLVAKMFGEIYNSFPIDSILSKYGAMLRSEYLRINDPYIDQFKKSPGASSIFENEIYIQGIAMYADTRLLSYSYERFANMGGAYGNSSRLFYNYNLENALPLKECDIFVPNYESSLIQLLKEQILKDNANIESIADLEELKYYEDRIRPNNNFYLTAEGLNYVFNAYEIAPYGTKQRSVLLTYEQLKPILKRDSPISYLYQNPIEYDE